MQKSWTTSGRALHLDLPPGLGQRIAIEQALRAAIRAGKLPLGAPLPSTRALAQDLGVARGTVVEAYGQLAAEGYLASRRGSGTVVAWARSAARARPRAAPAPAPRPRFSFLTGHPDLSAFPRAAWVHALRAALGRAPDVALDYGEARGRPELRSALADYLGRARGVVTTEEDLVICNGFGQGVGLLARVLLASGVRQVAVEDPGSNGTVRALRAAGLPCRPVAVDDQGLLVEALTEGDGAVVVTPAHQFPLGVTLSPARRAALVAWAARSRGLVIEDDYDGEFRYDRQPVGALQALDPSRVVYAGTASKVLAPGVRLGWLAVPPAWLGRVAEAKALADGLAPALDQLAMAELVRNGAFERHLRRARKIYRQRLDALLRQLERRVPELMPTGIAAGLHLVLRLPEGGPTEAALLSAALNRGVALEGLGALTLGEPLRPGGLLVGYGTPPANAFDASVEALVGALEGALRAPRPRGGRGPAAAA